MTFEEKVRKYAETLIKVGANVDKGQLVVIRALTEMRDFAAILAEEAFKAGAGDVQVIWRDDAISKIKYTYSSKEVIGNFKQYEIDEYNYGMENNGVYLSLIGGDPNALDGVDPEKLQIGVKARAKGLQRFYEDMMSDKNSWLVLGVPTIGWAKQVFPDLDEKAAYEKLWDVLFYVSRIDENSVENWTKHLAILSKKAEELNSLRFKYLKYTSEKGTNLTIELPKGHLWKAADSYNSKNRRFTANMPTEEVFTMPHKDGINGVVYSTKALSYNSNIIDEFWLEFKDGNVVNYDAKVGKEVLKTLLETDKGALSLGEVALVPYDSPISNTNIMFFETLYDENASCHLALGRAYPTCIENGTNMTKEELAKAGVNDSIVHVDFMIGDATLNIKGITEDGKEVDVFVNGNWA